MSALYLLPNTLGDSRTEYTIPSEVKNIICGLKIFATENPADTKRFLKILNKNISLDSIRFITLDKNSSCETLRELSVLIEKNDIGVISEAGCPGIADPGAELVEIAHKKGVKVVPLVGPSSILLALIASGLNGQNFAFHGYLPVKEHERTKKLKQLERSSAMEHKTQIFIETPYRNIKLYDALLNTLHNDTRLCIAAALTCPDEYIRTYTVVEWRGTPCPDIHKKPAIFLFIAG